MFSSRLQLREISPSHTGWDPSPCHRDASLYVCLSLVALVCVRKPRRWMRGGIGGRGVVSRGVADGGGGGPDPRTFENREGRPPPPDSRMKWPKSGVFFRLLWYFGVFWGWPPCRRFDPPLKNPWRRPWWCRTAPRVFPVWI